MTPIARWYERISAEDAAAAIPSAPQSTREKRLRKAKKHTSERLLPKLSTLTDNGPQIISAPPLILPLRDPTMRDTVDAW